MNINRTARSIPAQFFHPNTSYLEHKLATLQHGPASHRRDLPRKNVSDSSPRPHGNRANDGEVPRSSELKHFDPHKDEEVEVSVFGGLVNWAEPLRSADLTTILIRHHDSTPLSIQSHLLTTAVSSSRAYLHSSRATISPFPTPPVLDLTPFPVPASLLFMHYLLTKALPSQSTASLPAPTPLPAAHLPQRNDIPNPIISEVQLFSTTRQKQQCFNRGLTQAWRLGAALGAGGFQNEVLRRIARELEREEKEAKRSADPRLSGAVRWARDAWDVGTGGLPDICEGCGVPVGESNPQVEIKEMKQTRYLNMDWGRPLTEFAVDVAARRVWIVGAKHLVLNPTERMDLGGRPDFAGEVFARVTGQISLKGVGLGQLVRDCQVEEEEGLK